MQKSKSILKRIRITKRGKVRRRKMGVDHFRSKKTGKARRTLAKQVGLNYPLSYQN